MSDNLQILNLTMDSVYTTWELSCLSGVTQSDFLSNLSSFGRVLVHLTMSWKISQKLHHWSFSEISDNQIFSDLTVP